jgi:hypothetical protein
LKTVSGVAVVGLVLGGLVAVISHFTSHTLPSTYYVAINQSGSASDQSVASPLVHPSWWPVLPIALLVGLLAGLALGVLASRLNLRIVRAPV